MRLIIHQERPPHASRHQGLDQYAFPSGHTCAATAIVFTVATELWPVAGPKARAATVLLAAVTAGGVALTRLYLDEHWLDDIVGGWLAGVAIGSASVAVTQYASE
ncbi:MAG: phosphatase PAP2 family protein [Gemmatimonadaceae bacterium]